MTHTTEADNKGDYMCGVSTQLITNKYFNIKQFDDIALSLFHTYT